MPSDKDIVKRAWEILADPMMQPFLFGVTRNVFSDLADEVERLRKEVDALYKYELEGED